ncbi:hypothetical protein PACILC2_57240 [Paenibacillus cisolokensis]|uniref:Uncharacterized protein n=1 Tax=Paenibacillus cisolokensis TaxID=1658519 RepID=A0ABQ4NGY2_9BACL|nr:hypothetical protein [Paenibacillus cisolokensis]GIQ67156.1 hypothetical protein PACILC2_57240 [Paenibacillus cisolokensis]
MGREIAVWVNTSLVAATLFMAAYFRYLDDGSGNLSDLGNGKVSVWGQTLGTRKVDTIGIQTTLQRWTGSEWIDVNTGAKTTYSNASYAYSSREITVSTGYYYRVKSRHWIDYDDIHEEGTVYSDSLLIN